MDKIEKMMRKICFYALALILVLSQLQIITSTATATPDKPTVSLDATIETNENIKFNFYIGPGAKSGEMNRREISGSDIAGIWSDYRNRTGSDLEKSIATELGSCTNSKKFAEKLLGCDSIKSVEKIIMINYTNNGLGFDCSVIIGSSTIKPLGFLSNINDSSKVSELADIKININSIPGIDISGPEFAFLHFRLATNEILIYSSFENELKIHSHPVFSSLGAFIILVVCTGVSVGLCLYARKYFRGVKVSAHIWVLAGVFYFLAFIPFSMYILILLCGIGIVLSIVRSMKCILASRAKPPKKEAIPIEKYEEAVERYMGKEK